MVVVAVVSPTPLSSKVGTAGGGAGEGAVGAGAVGVGADGSAGAIGGVAAAGGGGGGCAGVVKAWVAPNLVVTVVADRGCVLCPPSGRAGGGDGGGAGAS